jgi:hypothetical protein
MVRQAGAGVAFAPEDAAALAEAAKALAGMAPAALQALGARGQAFYREQLSLAVGVQQFGAVFRRVAGQG